jgi:CBS domain-containing protein
VLERDLQTEQLGILLSACEENTMHAEDLMTHPAVTCHVNDSLNVAAQKMWDRDCGALAVVNDDGVVTGMLTDRDICMAAYTQGRRLDEILVNCAMTTHAICVAFDHPLGEVEQLMAKHGVRRIPVVDAENRPVGVISLDDLAIEAVEPDTPMKHGVSRVAHVFAAVCRLRAAKRNAA